MTSGFGARHSRPACWFVTSALVVAASVPAVALGATRTLSVGNAKITERSGSSVTARFPVRLSSPAARKVTVRYTTVNGTAKAPADYAARSGTLAFLRGQRTKYVSVPVVGDLLDEANETFALKISNPTRARIRDGKGVATIVDNDPLPALSVSDASVQEPDDSESATMTFTVALSATSGRVVKVNYTTSNGTATAPGDYTAISGTLSFPAGTSSRSILVPVLSDGADEVDETLTLTLSIPVNATLADASATGSIVAVGFGTIVGACGVVAPQLDEPTPSLFGNKVFDFGDDPYDDPEDQPLLTTGAQTIITSPSAGGSSLLSEVFAFETLARCEGASLVKTESQIVYDQAGATTDFLVAIAGSKVGVRVVRAFAFPLGNPYTSDAATTLLNSNLDDINESSQNVAAEDAWVKQILVVMAYDQQHADTIAAAWFGLDDPTKADTVVYVIITDGNDTNIYAN
jgi:hypothetical protein